MRSVAGASGRLPGWTGRPDAHMAITQVVHPVFYAALDTPNLGLQQAFSLFARLTRQNGVHEFRWTVDT